MKSLKSFWSNLPSEFKFFLLLFLFIGLVFRMVNLFNLGYTYDMVDTQYTWGKNAWEMGILGFWQNYPLSKTFDYPILSLVYEYIIYGISLIFGGSSFSFVAVLKTFNALVDTALLFTAFYILENFLLINIKKKSKKNNIRLLSVIFVSLFYISPSLWFIGSVWGQDDSLIVLLSLISIILLFQNKKILSGSVLASTILIKPQPILLLPVFALYFLQNKNGKDILRAIKKLLIFSIIFIPVVFELFLIKPYLQDIVNQVNLGIQDIYFDPIFIRYMTIVAFTFAIIILVSAYILYKRMQIKNPWQDTEKWLFGFILIYTILEPLLMILNPLRAWKILLDPFSRADAINNGAANLWQLLQLNGHVSKVLFSIFHLHFSVSLVSYSLFFLTMIIFFISYLKLKVFNTFKINLSPISFESFLLICTILSITYYILFTRMMSRYLHIGLIFVLILSFFFIAKDKTKYKVYSIILMSSILLMNVGYFLNNLAVFDAQSSNFDNTSALGISNVMWVRNFLDLLSINASLFASILIIISFVFIFVVLNNEDWFQKTRNI